ncbi:Putative Pseudouridine synthase, Rsu:RNA-binding S4:Pseudouridine synthase [Bradyrhizobium sp. ORS 285]|uniref:pseudouridine synthase n=1 Tax=Bradyrhizobium sp. ORS 285 TaxID=115808 RepID=UPI00024083D9|nr:pseudouridine synthase [Bradyrhizobium sp. ORS 285]CCD85060.1 putative Pseudouridine synthase, Rsu:RNA-binding S4:Pseudouridine synthase [Bradyrhizobium sp. ORS 285]SMX60820.1 Putative Pseudouridine synthase, Rsu:RNA-binding S4:Pseudouridine synthase [Bradyrhizobium sp. ORS 285]
MPRDTDKDNDSRGRRGGAPRGRSEGPKGRSGAARGPEKKFAKRGFGDKEGGGKSFAKRDGGKRSFDEGRAPRRRDDGDAPRKSYGDKPRFNRDERPRGDRPYAARSGDGEKRAFKPRGDRPKFDRDDRGGEKRPYTPRAGRDEARPAGRSSERKFGERKPYASRERDGEKRPYTPRGEGARDRGDRPARSFGDRPPRGGDRPERKFGGERKFSRGAEGDRGERKFGGGARGPRKEFGDRPPRGESKPWQKRDGEGDRGARSSREGGRSYDRPRSDRTREDRPKFDRPRDRGDDRGFDKPRRRPEGRTDWQEHPRSERRDFGDRPRRDNENDSEIFAKRPAFGGRGPYRERKPEPEKRSKRVVPDEAPRPGKTGERIAKVLARAGLASRRDAEEMVTQGRVSVNGRVINSPALDVTENDEIKVDGAPLPERERTRLFLYHKPRGLMTTHSDPEGRPTVFDNLPEGLPRLISIGRLDFNTEGLLLLTNDGGLARVLELPDTGWTRRYRVRAHGEITQGQLDQLAAGVEVDGVKYGPIEATLERDQGANVWLVVAIREGKNREVRNVLAHLGLEVNRLIRVSYGPFQLLELPEGEVQEVKTRVLREQLGEKVIAQSGADLGPAGAGNREPLPDPKPKPKREVVADRKGRRVLVQRTGSEEARERHEAEARFPGPPKRPKRGYHGKRDISPRDDE